MSSETITTAIFLITAVVAAAVLVNAIFPIIYTVSDTASSASHAADERLRTDVKIINTFASAGGHDARIWLKNTGTSRISAAALNTSDIFIGAPGDFDRVSQGTDGWEATILDGDVDYWLPGETVRIDIMDNLLIPDTKGDSVYFQVVLPGGAARTKEFTAGV
ncbi:flagellar protein FlaG [Methanofollis sp. W23]|uniref:flagellin n=1 Tax=Methanofollis sp. W23 TaxID=2817849 RepID=UPI001AE56866|nr:flagellin [Methanofollis sp. W23]MBP2145179.1 flagellar protein FlaG [Methanofollis sp. W23]